MREAWIQYHPHRLSGGIRHGPYTGQIELTRRCNLKCVHCYYSGGGEPRRKELSTGEWKKLLMVIAREGCIFLTMTGGEPLVRDDFLEIYAYAQKKGFVITLFSNGQAFTKEIVRYLEKNRPFRVEITVNSITRGLYESITGVSGSFERLMRSLELLKGARLPLVFKSNCLKQNKKEICKIKKFTDSYLGKPRGGGTRFIYDPILYPGISGSSQPGACRVSVSELAGLRRSDFDILNEYTNGICESSSVLNRERSCLYQCDTWLTNFFINPYGRVKFCNFSDKFSADFREVPFKKIFYGMFPRLLNERFKTVSSCRNCSLRPVCNWCPAVAFLENGDEEAPVKYFCALARAQMRDRGKGLREVKAGHG
jgi:radical SAM protein with 4Fe4S-binding SPASM domain